MATHLHYTPDELQAQYSARAAVPEHPQIFRRWQQLSQQYRAEASCKLDIRYGESERQLLDLFLPNNTLAPLLVFIHGGYWQAMDKSDSSFLAEELVKQGAAVAVVNYGLCPAVTMDEITRQLRQGIQWLCHHAKDYGFDGNRIHLCGHSAGGHLAVMMLTNDWTKAPFSLPADLIKSVIAVSGLFELEPLIHTRINLALGLNQAMARKNSPLLLEPLSKAPIRLFVGGEESEEFHRQSIDFQTVWSARGMDIDYQDLPGLHHFNMIEQLTRRESHLYLMVSRLMGLNSVPGSNE